MLQKLIKKFNELKKKGQSDPSGKLQMVIVSVLVAILALILVLLVVGNNSMVTQINNALAGICNSGWPLATLFNATSGIVPLLIVVGLFIASIVGAFRIGGAFSEGVGKR